MAGEFAHAKQLVEQAMTQDGFDKNTMGQALIAAVLEQYRAYRKLADVKSELQFTIDNLDEDEFVITRGC